MPQEPIPKPELAKAATPLSKTWSALIYLGYCYSVVVFVLAVVALANFNSRPEKPSTGPAEFTSESQSKFATTKSEFETKSFSTGNPSARTRKKN